MKCFFFNKKKGTYHFEDFTVPVDLKGRIKENKKTNKYLNLARAFKKLHNMKVMKGSTRGVMVIVVGNGHGNTSSNPGQDWLHFT